MNSPVMVARSKVRIRDRIVVMVVISIINVALLCVVTTWSVHRRQAADHWVEQTQNTLRHLSEFSEMIMQGETALRGYFLTEGKEFLEQFELVHANYRDKFEDLQTLMAENPVRQCDMQRLGALADRKVALGDQALARAQASDFGGAIALVRTGEMRAVMAEFQAVRRVCANEEFQLLAERRGAAMQEGINVLLTVIMGGVLSVSVLALMAWRAIDQIQTPLNSLLQDIKAFGDGDFSRRVQVCSKDELGEVANSFNDMAEHLQEALVARHRAESELTASMQELERSNHELDQFAYVASHDLKAPLRGIRSLAEWIADDVKATASADTMENLALLQNRVERLDLLLDSLLQYSRVGRAGGKAEEVETCQLVHDIAGYLAPKPGFVIDCSDTMPELYTFKAPLELVFRNLISNALKHHDGDHGKVTVTGKWNGKLAEFRIEDDGPGIPPAFHQKIFQMFQTLKPRDQVEGSGMGLAIVKKTVESQGGSIRVESEADRRGTSFIFTWAPTPQ